MDSENRLRHELVELNLLLRGLAQVPGFPADLLELISGKIKSISLLALKPEAQMLTDEVEIHLDNLSGDMVMSSGEPAFDEVTVVEVHSTAAPHLTRINDQMGQIRLMDLARSLTLNDRFRFQREFFENDPQKMSEVFSFINTTQSAEEALDYLRGVCTVDEHSDCFQDFSAMLHLHFANVSGVGQSN